MQSRFAEKIEALTRHEPPVCVDAVKWLDFAHSSSMLMHNAR
jgi:hypothetical protein